MRQTQLLKIDGIERCSAELDRAAQIIAGGGLVAIPTETVYGLAADALNGRAVRKIFEAKGRPMDNPLIVHIADISDWAALVTHIPEKARALAAAYWPGPLTMILPHAPCIPDEVSAGLATVAVRFPAHPVARDLIRLTGRPLAAPSANRSGIPSPTTAAHVLADMEGRIAAVVDGGPCAVGVESTVVDLSGETPRLLRPGGVTLEMLEAVAGPVDVDGAVTHALQEGAAAASPGMKYKHYAPKADVTLLEGTFEQFKAYVDAHADQNPSCLCFTGEAEKLGWPCVEYGREGDGADQAKHIFRSLRALDEQGDGVVYARCPKKDGLSMAVYNRLIRAAAFRVIQL